MNKLLASFFVLLLGLVPVGAQNVDWPPPAGSIAFLGVFNTVAPTMTNGKAGWAQLDVNGNVKVNIAAGAGSGGTSATDQAAFTQGVSGFNPVGCTFSDASTLGAGQQGTVRCNTKRAQIVDVDSTGNQLHSDLIAPIPAGTNRTGYVTDDPCSGAAAKTTLPITLATAAVKVIATGVAAKKIYVCQINLNNNAADTVAVFEATTATVCVTSPVAVVGAGTSVATAGTGYNFAATGGISIGNGASQVLVTTVNNNDLCVAQSAATQLSGSITYVTQ